MKQSCVFGFCLFLAACASQPPLVVDDVAKPAVMPKLIPQLESSNWTESNLQEFHSKWQGTPYRLGGISKQGVDCSGFVYLAYLDIVGEKLPRTVIAQRDLGKTVPRNLLQVGDLVFFKTTNRTRHVGIYMGDETFLHASTKKGVIISSLNNPYWASKYKMAKRLH